MGCVRRRRQEEREAWGTLSACRPKLSATVSLIRVQVYLFVRRCSDRLNGRAGGRRGAGERESGRERQCEFAQGRLCCTDMQEGEWLAPKGVSAVG